jgi:hypothetical protein
MESKTTQNRAMFLHKNWSLVKREIWGIALYGTGAWMLQKLDQNWLKVFKCGAGEARRRSAGPIVWEMKWHTQREEEYPTYSMQQNPSWQLTGSQLVNKFPALYGTRRLITTFTKACHLSLSWASSIQYIPYTQQRLIGLTTCCLRNVFLKQ